MSCSAGDNLTWFRFWWSSQKVISRLRSVRASSASNLCDKKVLIRVTVEMMEHDMPLSILSTTAAPGCTNPLRIRYFKQKTHYYSENFRKGFGVWGLGFGVWGL